MRRTPDAASGCPSAIAPPHWLTRGSSSAMPKWSRSDSTCTANASFSSNRPMSSILSPAFFRAFSVEGIGPMPMISGWTPANANETMRIFGFRPSSFTAPPPASSDIVAPSVRGEEVPAVTRPCGRNGVLRLARSSIVVSGRRPSSSVARPQPPSASLIATVTRSGWNLPASYAACALCWLSMPKRSERSLVSCGKRSKMRSAVTPMLSAPGSTMRSETNRGFGSALPPMG